MKMLVIPESSQCYHSFYMRPYEYNQNRTKARKNNRNKSTRGAIEKATKKKDVDDVVGTSRVSCPFPLPKSLASAQVFGQQTEESSRTPKAGVVMGAHAKNFNSAAKVSLT